MSKKVFRVYDQEENNQCLSVSAENYAEVERLWYAEFSVMPVRIELLPGELEEIESDILQLFKVPTEIETDLGTVVFDRYIVAINIEEAKKLYVTKFKSAPKKVKRCLGELLIQEELRIN